MKACAADGDSVLRIITPALVQTLTFWIEATRATIGPSPSSVGRRMEGIGGAPDVGARAGDRERAGAKVAVPAAPFAPTSAWLQPAGSAMAAAKRHVTVIDTVPEVVDCARRCRWRQRSACSCPRRTLLQVTRVGRRRGACRSAWRLRRSPPCAIVPSLSLALAVSVTVAGAVKLLPPAGLVSPAVGGALPGTQWDTVVLSNTAPSRPMAFSVSMHASTATFTYSWREALNAVQLLVPAGYSGAPPPPVTTYGTTGRSRSRSRESGCVRS